MEFTKNCIDVIMADDSIGRQTGRTRNALSRLKDNDVFVSSHPGQITNLKKYIKEQGFAKIIVVKCPTIIGVPISTVMAQIDKQLEGKEYGSIVFDHWIQMNLILQQIRAFVKFQETLIKK